MLFTPPAPLLQTQGKTMPSSCASPALFLLHTYLTITRQFALKES